MAPTTWPFLASPVPIAFAHRGGAGDWPENTMAAFEQAIALGYQYLETDVHVTADGTAVAFHDDVLDRVTDRRGRIDSLPWSEVSQARVDGHAIPRLEDLLGTWPEARVNIDPKHDASVEPLVDVVDRTGAHDRVCVTSFSDRRLARFRTLTGGRVCTGTGPLDIARLRAAGWRVPSGRVSGACAQVPVRYKGIPVVDPRFLAAAHRRGLPVHVWTVDDPAEIERLLDLGVDGIMTDRPGVLKEVLKRRREWVD